MKAIIKSRYSSDLDVETYRPVDPFDDGQWIRLLVGPEGGLGEESFDVLVCTTHWLAREIGRDGMQLVRHTPVMEKFDLSRAIERLHHGVGLASGATWQELLLSLVQIGRWEFDGSSDVSYAFCMRRVVMG
ncbi:MAG: Imm8 family immunity protein, partial [Microbacterium sp.]